MLKNDDEISKLSEIKIACNFIINQSVSTFYLENALSNLTDTYSYVFVK